MKLILGLFSLICFFAATSFAVPMIASRSNTFVKKCLDIFGLGAMMYCKRAYAMPATSTGEYTIQEMSSERYYPKKPTGFDNDMLKNYRYNDQYSRDKGADRHYSGHSYRSYDAGTARPARMIEDHHSKHPGKLLSRRQPNIPQGYFSQENFPDWERHLDSEIKAYFGRS